MKKTFETVLVGQALFKTVWRTAWATVVVGAVAACGGGGGNDNANAAAIAAVVAANAAASLGPPPTAVVPVPPVEPAGPTEVVPPEKKTRWATTWQVALRANFMQNEDSDTVRMRIRTSVGGEGVRIRLSNVFGTATMRVDHASVALPDARDASDPTAIDLGTRKVLTFNGKTLAEVPAGTELLSDPVSMNVPKLSDLLITLHFQGNTQYADMHMDKSVPLPGYFVVRKRDVSGEASIKTAAPNYQTYDGAFSLSEVKVLAPEQARVVIAMSESITAGFGAKGIQESWPAVLSKLANSNGELLGVGNAGISGNSMIGSDNGPSLRSRFERDVLSRDPTDIVILAGDNDLNQGYTTDRIIEHYKYFVETARARKIKVYGGVNTPIGNIPGIGDAGETGFVKDPANYGKWLKINEWIKTPGNFDGVIDFPAVVSNPASMPLALSSDCYMPGSPIHLNTRGLDVMGTLAYDVLYGKKEKPAAPCNGLEFPPSN
ncbi:GDSL-type esterase/lipase family protein [Variovorax paradoxus]|uniref:GDSL-type esterase/lipase family protein n=1 Tax=Variovorax paradoxus TaxID=34073 RepID=UPI001ABCE2AF